MTERLRAAGYAFGPVARTSGRAGTGPLGAHSSVEESPGHRRNLLLPVYTRLGVGDRAGDGRRTHRRRCWWKSWRHRTTRSGDPVGDAYRRIAEQRAALGLPALARSPQLEAVAAEQARLALDADDPHTERLLAPERLHARVAESLRGVDSTSADLFVAEDVSQLPEDARSRGRTEEPGRRGSGPRGPGSGRRRDVLGGGDLRRPTVTAAAPQRVRWRRRWVA